MENLLKPSEAAKRLGVTIGTLERWRCGRSGPRLPFVKLGEHGAVRYREADVDAVIADNVRGTNGAEVAA